MHNVASTRMNSPENILLSLCPLAVLGSQGIVVKCTDAIFFNISVGRRCITFKTPIHTVKRKVKTKAMHSPVGPRFVNL